MYMNVYLTELSFVDEELRFLFFVIIYNIDI